MNTKIKPNSVDLTVTSPPYDNLREYDNSLEWNFDIFKRVAESLHRVTAPGGVVVWIVNDATIDGGETGMSFRQALFFQEIGFKINDTMIWTKQNPVPSNSKSRYQNRFEYMFVFSKGQPKTFNPIKIPSISGARTVTETIGRKKDGTRGKAVEKTYGDTKTDFNVWETSVGSSSAKDKIAFEP